MDKKIFDLVEFLYKDDDDEILHGKESHEDEISEHDEEEDKKHAQVNNLMSKVGGAMVGLV